MGSVRLLLVGTAGLLAFPAAAQDSREAEAGKAFITYPKESLKWREEGIVHYRVKIDARGRARECAVTQSSGYHRLDIATCNLLMDNANFTPAQNSGGKATRSTYEGRVHWRLS